MASSSASSLAAFINTKGVWRSDLVAVAPFEETTGRGIQARAEIQRGTLLAEVPLADVWSAAAARQQRELSAVFASARWLSDDDCLAVHLMWARCNPGLITAAQRAHLELLPAVQRGPSPLNHSMFWTDDELAELQGSRSFTVAHALKSQVRKDFGRLLAELFLPNPALFPIHEAGVDGETHSFSYREYKWALAVLWSRAMDFAGAAPDGTSNLRCIVPMIDLFNTCSGVPVAHYYSKAKQTISVLSSAHEARMPGDQVFIQYGPSGNARKLQVYGYADVVNPHDVVELWCTMDQAQPEYAEVARAIAAELKGFDCNTTPFQLMLNDPLPDDILVALRLQRGCPPRRGVGSVSAEADAAELAVLLSLQAGLIAMLQAYVFAGSVKEDEELLKNPMGLGVRKRFAVMTRLGEKRILLAALEKIEGLIANLGDVQNRPVVLDDEDEDGDGIDVLD